MQMLLLPNYDGSEKIRKGVIRQGKLLPFFAT